MRERDAESWDRLTARLERIRQTAAPEKGPRLARPARQPGGDAAMPQATRTFRVFISSTFSDLKEERNALQRYVFPRLRELCQQHGCRFQAIDLRWGIRDEAALDQRTMSICLEEIARCQRVTP